MSVLEHVVLTIDPAEADAYEAAFHEARPLIESQPGCGGARLVRVMETPGRYVLLVEWATLEDHMDGFRSSPEFPRWRELPPPLLRHPPEVEHALAAASGCGGPGRHSGGLGGGGRPGELDHPDDAMAVPAKGSSSSSIWSSSPSCAPVSAKTTWAPTWASPTRDGVRVAVSSLPDLRRCPDADARQRPQRGIGVRGWHRQRLLERGSPRCGGHEGARAFRADPGLVPFPRRNVLPAQRIRRHGQSRGG